MIAPGMAASRETPAKVASRHVALLPADDEDDFASIEEESERVAARMNENESRHRQGSSIIITILVMTCEESVI